MHAAGAPAGGTGPGGSKTNGGVGWAFKSSVLDNLGKTTNRNVTLEGKVELFLNGIAPDTPTIDDYYTLTSMQTAMPNGNNVRILAVRKAKYTIPLVFQLNPKDTTTAAKAKQFFMPLSV